MKCFACGKEYTAFNEDAGTYRESFCSLECEAKHGDLVAEKIMDENEITKMYASHMFMYIPDLTAHLSTLKLQGVCLRCSLMMLSYFTGKYMATAYRITEETGMDLEEFLEGVYIYQDLKTKLCTCSR